MATTPLTETEIALWHAFKRAAEIVRGRIAAEITRETGLSDADFGIVTRIVDAGSSMRQNELAASMGWHRSRLSHQLTRMVDRRLVRRLEVDNGVEVEITDEGRTVAELARPVHAAAVRTLLIERIPADQRVGFTELLQTLADETK
ncbi:MarR family winged helix-turn-helix transcriptional regulator [Kribbella sp. NPDC051718]|uniref:MarR family winged helix-turn-helix transcriptional regulator n=1 Tax=Kribbella sp. NPDC051718 TaxID=3155168 RepID=UPI003447F7F5